MKPDRKNHPRKRAGKGEIFSRFGITKASQFRAKSDQWFQIVQFLFGGRRYSGAVYLGGFVVECLLKAALWARRDEPKIRSLIFGSHDLPELLGANPFLERAMERDRLGAYDHFVGISSWHVRLRYNTKPVHREDAEAFLIHLRGVRLWLRNRV